MDHMSIIRNPQVTRRTGSIFIAIRMIWSSASQRPKAFTQTFSFAHEGWEKSTDPSVASVRCHFAAANDDPFSFAHEGWKKSADHSNHTKILFLSPKFSLTQLFLFLSPNYISYFLWLVVLLRLAHCRADFLPVCRQNLFFISCRLFMFLRQCFPLQIKYVSFATRKDPRKL